MTSRSNRKSPSQDDDGEVDNYYDLDDKNSRTVGIKELDLNTLYPQHPRDFKNGSKYCFIGKPGCLLKGTKIIMFDGTVKNVEDIEIGDILMGDDSTPRNVLDLARGREEMYDVIPTRGDKYTVNKSHMLSLKSIGFPNHPKDKIIDISVEDFLNLRELYEGYKGFKTGVEFHPINVDFHPWMVGYQIGSGGISRRVPESNDIFSFSTRYVPDEELKDLYSYIKSLNIINHIPREYLINSRSVRFQD